MIHTPFPDFLQVRVRLELCTTGVFVSLDISLSPPGGIIIPKIYANDSISCGFQVCCCLLKALVDLLVEEAYSAPCSGPATGNLSVDHVNVLKL